MKPICLIPARSGSKGLKDKNMMFFDSKPLIFHTIDAALESGYFDKENIYVSTDSEIYKEICETKGVKVVLRSTELAKDTTTSYEVNVDFLKNFEDDQVFVLLQITSPLRTGKHIKEAMDMYYEDRTVDNLVSYTKVDKSPILYTGLDENGFILESYGADTNYRRQDQKTWYRPNGAIYITSKKVYLNNKSYYTPKTKVYLMDKDSSVDIDDRSDLVAAIGTRFFNYELREKKNKSFYRDVYKRLVEGKILKNVIFGDSRLEGLKFEGYDNISIGGVTVATLNENIYYILERNKIEKAMIVMGINDFITSYSMDEIKNNFKEVIKKLKDKGVEIVVSKIVYALFRDSVNNDDVKEINDWLEESKNALGIELVDFNDSLSKNGYLKYEYTYDGLHYNEQGREVLKIDIEKLIKKD